MYRPPTCVCCHQPADRLITVVNADGSYRVCGLCCVRLLAANESRGDITVFIAGSVPA